MMAIKRAATAQIHTGPWEAFPRLAGASRRLGRTVMSTLRSPVRLYYLLNAHGKRIGVITAPVARPELGRHAPTVYLRRT
jgi:hypothetical protein